MASVTTQPTKTNQGQEIFGHHSGMNQPKFHSAATIFPVKSARTSKAGRVILHRTSTELMPMIMATTLTPSRPRLRVNIPKRKTASKAP